MKAILSVFIIGLVLTTTGCRTTSVTPVSGSSTKKLDRTANVYITTPNDGNYGKEEYRGSGSEVTSALQAAFTRYANDVIVGGAVDSTSDAIDAAKRKGCQYSVIPKINHWEDRATEWSGIRDKLVVYIKVVSVEDAAEVTSVEVSGKSSWFTFGGDHPQDLLKSPIQQFVKTLY